MKESDIRPRELLNEYLRLSAKDAKQLFSKELRRDIECVACGSNEKECKFEKSGFEYSQCLSCGTLYQSPRPRMSEFEKFYKDSDSSNYWSDVFFPYVAESRREKIIVPKVEHIGKKIQDRGSKVKTLIDVGAGFGIFLEEWVKRYPETNAVAIEPSSTLANKCREKGLVVEEAMAEDVHGFDEFADLVVCFEVIEHVDNPLSFLKILNNKTKKGGNVLITTLCIDGFDLQTLWDKSDAISPPFHINFMSVEGFKILFDRAGFHDIDILTPGKLDADIVKNAIERDDSIIVDDFLMKILRDPNKSEKFQNFLSSNQLSSHVWVIGRK